MFLISEDVRNLSPDFSREFIIIKGCLNLILMLILLMIE